MNDDDLSLAITKVETGINTDYIAELYGKITWMIKRGQELKGELEARMEQIINETGQPIEWVIDDEGHKMCFWNGHDKSVKCIDVGKALEFLMGLSMDDAQACLSANAFKHGSFRKLMKQLGREAEFDQFFKTVVKDKLESGEELPKKLQNLNTRFIT